MTATITDLAAYKQDADPFIASVAATLIAAGFPADLISWLHLPAPASRELAAAMGSPVNAGGVAAVNADLGAAAFPSAAPVQHTLAGAP